MNSDDDYSNFSVCSFFNSTLEISNYRAFSPLDKLPLEDFSNLNDFSTAVIIGLASFLLNGSYLVGMIGLPPRYRDSVRQITPGLPIFLYNYSTHQLHGIFEAASFGGSNLDPTAWEDKKCPGESRFPAQVRVITRKICEPLEEDSFRPILHHYDGPKFRLELNVPEALSLLDIFADQDLNLTGLISFDDNE